MVAGVVLSSRMQFAHRGCADKNILRYLAHLESYPLSWAVRLSPSLLYAPSFACEVQKRSCVRAGHPGYLHGFFGLYGNGYPYSKGLRAHALRMRCFRPCSLCTAGAYIAWAYSLLCLVCREDPSVEARTVSACTRMSALHPRKRWYRVCV